eukprot:428164_1
MLPQQFAVTERDSISSIIGIALVCEDISKGQKLVFRYPPERKDFALSGACGDTSNRAGRRRACRLLAQKEFRSIDADNFAKLFRPKPTLCDESGVFRMIIDQVGYVSRPTDLHSFKQEERDGDTGTYRAQRRGVDNRENTKDAGKRRQEIIFYNVVLAMVDDVEEGFKNDDNFIHGVHMGHPDQASDVAVTLGKSLFHEELRANYVRQEVESLLAIRDRGVEEGEDPDGGRLIGQMLQTSSLARFLQEVYYSLLTGTGIHIPLNFDITVSLTKAKMPKSLKPFQTLILLQDEQTVLSNMPPDFSPQLRALVESVNPLISFEEMADIMYMPLEHVYRLASHLVLWGKARLVDTVVLHNVYQVVPEADISSGTLLKEFSQKFPWRSLLLVLAKFQGMTSLQNIIEGVSKGERLQLLHMVVWMLQRELLQQLRRYVSLLVSEAELKKLADKTHCYHLLLRLQPYFRPNDEGHVVSLREAIWELRASAVEVDEVLSIYDHILLQYVC